MSDEIENYTLNDGLEFQDRLNWIISEAGTEEEMMFRLEIGDMEQDILRAIIEAKEVKTGKIVDKVLTTIKGYISIQYEEQIELHEGKRDMGDTIGESYHQGQIAAFDKVVARLDKMIERFEEQ